MIKAASSVAVPVAVVFLAFVVFIAQSEPLVIKPEPASPSFNINHSQIANAGTCTYTVTITTSCKSPRYTRDQISLSFGDAYGNQVYAPRIDDPSSGAFEGCSTDTYSIYGPCLYHVCYLYLYRSGYDGWIPESVQVYSYYTGYDTFYYNTYVPNNVWYGFNYCNGVSSTKPHMNWLRHAFQALFCFQCWKGLLSELW